jgi:GTP cyclohydrolase IB
MSPRPRLAGAGYRGLPPARALVTLAGVCKGLLQRAIDGAGAQHGFVDWNYFRVHYSDSRPDEPRRHAGVALVQAEHRRGGGPLPASPTSPRDLLSHNPGMPSGAGSGSSVQGTRMTQAKAVTSHEIPDVQGSPDTRRLDIDRVGIKAIRHPCVVKDRSGGTQHTVATFNMYVGLPHNFKGTHMSRFVEVLNAHEQAITVESFQRILWEMTNRLDAESGHIEMSFPYFVNKTAPVSGVKSLLDYEVSFIGEITQGKPQTTVKVVVPVTTLCPCSKNISNYGAHNQRSHVTVAARIGDFIWVEELIDWVEAVASCELYGLLKRPDEKYVTERAYDNPKFVEDMVRDVAAKLNDDDRIRAYTVESENFESIHNHSAYAMIVRDKDAEPALTES